MIRYLRLLFAVQLLIPFFGNAQRSCGTMEHLTLQQSNDPKLGMRMAQDEIKLQQWITENAESINGRMVVTIPVVVHVVYQNTGENISDAQVITQIDVLNEDFRRLNTDAVNTPSVWQGIAADAEIEFCLAQRDENDSTTTGIERRQTTASSFNLNDNVKFYSSGGLDAWDTEKYFNIWVCDLGNSLLGYAEFPASQTSNTFGVVIHYEAFGTIGNLYPAFDQGRTTVHEIGHCFNLYHIWGDDGNSCNGSDNVSDTPNQADEHYGCPNFPSVSCSNGPNGDMFMNYMDYSNDDCMNLFTIGQKTRMVSALNNFYPTLITSDGCVPVILQPLDAGIQQITEPTGSYCSTTVTPQIVLKNFGLNNLTSVEINYQVDGGTVTTYNWSGNLGSLQTTNVSLTAFNTTNGSHSFYAYTSDPNSGTDLVPFNDDMSSTFNAVTIGQSAPVSQEFSSISTFPPANWSITNPDGDYTWEGSTPGYLSTYSAFIDNFNYAANGEVDDLVMPSVNLTTVSNPVLSFYVAYQLYTNPNASTPYSDTLEVLVSGDCGASWQTEYKKFSTDLVTASPIYSSTFFTPSSAEWRQEIIDLADFATSNNAIVMFRNITDYENSLYIDKVNISAATNVPIVFVAPEMQVYPNPSEGWISVQGIPIGTNHILVINSLGQVVKTFSNTNSVGVTELDLTSLSGGLYSLLVSSDQQARTVRVVLVMD